MRVYPPLLAGRGAYRVRISTVLPTTLVELGMHAGHAIRRASVTDAYCDTVRDLAWLAQWNAKATASRDDFKLEA